MEQASAHANQAAMKTFEEDVDASEVVALDRARDWDRIHTLAYQARREQAHAISRAFANGQLKRAVQAATAVPAPPDEDATAYQLARQAALRASQACL